MAAKTPEIITEYDVLFAVRTGVTILLPKTTVFDGGVDIPAYFTAHYTGKSGDVTVVAGDRSFVLRDLREDYLEQVLARGSIMFYELKDEEVVRCTPCALRK